MKCAIDDCHKEIHCKNFCNAHYRMFMKYGDPLIRQNRPLGEGTPHNRGYWAFEINGRAINRHVLIVEKVLGKKLPKGVEIHHVDGIKDHDINSNLVVCQDRTYHFLLERRTKALKECGHASWRKCQICKQYSPPEDLKIYSNGVKWHSSCWADKFGKRRKKNVIHV